MATVYGAHKLGAWTNKPDASHQWFMEDVNLEITHMATRKPLMDMVLHQRQGSSIVINSSRQPHIFLIHQQYG